MKKKICFDLRGYRRRTNLTQEELAERIGVQQSAISKFELNAECVNLTTINRIANALNIDAMELLKEV